MMTYRGYQAKVELDEEAGTFHGEVIDTSHVITCRGCSVLEFCASRGEDQERPFPGGRAETN